MKRLLHGTLRLRNSPKGEQIQNGRLTDEIPWDTITPWCGLALFCRSFSLAEFSVLKILAFSFTKQVSWLGTHIEVQLRWRNTKTIIHTNVHRSLHTHQTLCNLSFGGQGYNFHSFGSQKQITSGQGEGVRGKNMLRDPEEQVRSSLGPFSKNVWL